MIRDINFRYPQVLEFTGKNGTCLFLPSWPYTRIISFLQVDDGIICVLEGNKENLTDEQRRRNVYKIDEEGKIVWQMADPYPFWEKFIPKKNKYREESLKSHHKRFIGSIKKIDDKVVLEQAGETGYFLDPDTGNIKYWKTDRGGI